MGFRYTPSPRIIEVDGVAPGMVQWVQAVYFPSVLRGLYNWVYPIASNSG